MDILCFGDSNTWGANPSGGRWPRDVRWPGRLQAMLGDGHHVVEDGLCGRTTGFDDPFIRDRSGLQALPLSLEIHEPLDVVILALGINDCQTQYGATPRVIARGAQRLVETVLQFPYEESFPIPKVLLISPAYTGDAISGSRFAGYDDTSKEKSHALAPLFAQVAQENGCLFLNGATVLSASPIDQLHFDAEAHAALAEAVAASLRNILH